MLIVLGAFAKLQKATISFVMYVCPSGQSVRMKELGSHWMEFHDIAYLNIFRKCIEESPVSLKYDKNNGHFMIVPRREWPG